MLVYGQPRRVRGLEPALCRPNAESSPGLDRPGKTLDFKPEGACYTLLQIDTKSHKPMIAR
jgi:hypothetical protein